MIRVPPGETVHRCICRFLGGREDFLDIEGSVQSMDLYNPYKHKFIVIYKREAGDLVKIVGYCTPTDLENVMQYPPLPEPAPKRQKKHERIDIMIPWGARVRRTDGFTRLAPVLDINDTAGLMLAILIRRQDALPYLCNELRRLIEEHSDAAVAQWLIDESVNLAPVDPLPQDTRDFPHETGYLWFRAKFYDFPRSIAKNLIVHEGGWAHVPKRLIADWICCNIERRIVPLSEVMKDEQMKVLFGAPEPTTVVLKLPQCLQNILASDSFPKDAARQAFVRILAKAGVPLAQVLDLLRPLMDNEKQRTDWVTRHYNGKYPPPRCAGMKPWCPFNDLRDCAGDVEDLAERLRIKGPVGYLSRTRNA